MKRYTIPSEHIWYDKDTDTSSSVREDKNQIKFDSRAEFEFYRSLLPLSATFGFSIFKDCMLNLESTKWLVDFKLVFPMESLPVVNNILSHLNQYPTVNHLPVVYIEYKGVLTSQSANKLDLLARSEYDKLLVMVAEKPQVYIKENLTNLTIIRKTLYSKRFFLALLTTQLMKGEKNYGS